MMATDISDVHWEAPSSISSPGDQLEIHGAREVLLGESSS